MSYVSLVVCVMSKRNLIDGHGYIWADCETLGELDCQFPIVTYTYGRAPICITLVQPQTNLRHAPLETFLTCENCLGPEGTVDTGVKHTRWEICSRVSHSPHPHKIDSLTM